MRIACFRGRAGGRGTVGGEEELLEALRSTRVSNEKRCARNGTDQLNVLRPEARLALEAEERIRLLCRKVRAGNTASAQQYKMQRMGGTDVKRGEGGRI